MIRKTAIILAGLLSGAGVHALPQNALQAEAGFNARRTNLVKAFALSYQYGRYKGEAAFPAWSSSSSRALREIAAGLYVFANPNSFGPTYFPYLSGIAPASTLSQHLSAYQTLVGNYLNGINPFDHDVGSNFGSKPGDYDFTLKEITSLVYGFIDRPDILTNDMVWHLLDQNASSMGFDGRSNHQSSGILWADQRVDEGILVPKAKVFSVDVWGVTNSVYVTLSETENHLMMIYSWKYLINNYIRWVAGLPSSHPRYDSRIAAIFHTDPTRYTNGAVLNDFVLRMMGRILHRGAFETDAKAYSTYTFNAMMNFYSYSAKLFPNDQSCQKVRVGAQNALDYLAANFAFQSLEGKRNVPMRRNWDYKDRYAPYANDYLVHMLGMWAGAYAFDDTNGEAEMSAGYTPPSDLYKKPYHFYNIDNGNYQPAGFALWAALSDYRIPRIIEDFLLNKHNGWIVKNQTNFYKYEYWYDWATNSMPNTTAIIPNYFGTGGSSSELHPVSQSFFVTKDFLNSGGGIFDQYANPEICEAGYCKTIDEINQWNAITKPLMLITKGDIGYGGEDGNDWAQLEQQFLTNFAGANSYDGKTLGIYKSFSLGFDPSGLGLFRFPAAWKQDPSQTVSKNGMQYTVYDFRSSSNGLQNYYLILASALTFSHAYGNSVYAGWWEVVPGAMYPSLSALASYISSNNPNLGGSTAAQPKSGEQYKYKMASTGDVITVNFDLSSTKDVSIASIVDKNNADMSSLVFANNNAPATAITTVWEVDQNYQLTNLKYAENPTEGKIIIRNPFISSSDFVINSVDYANPSSSNPYRVPVKYRPPITAALSLLMN